MGSTDEALGIDNFKLVRLVAPVYERHDALQYESNACTHSTDRYVCSTNEAWSAGMIANEMRLMGYPVVATQSVSQTYHAPGASTVSYKALLSACNEFGCSLPVTLSTTSPRRPKKVGLSKNTSHFIANISLSSDGGIPISAINTVLHSYDTAGNLVTRADVTEVKTAHFGYALVPLKPISSLGCLPNARQVCAIPLDAVRVRHLLLLALKMQSHQSGVASRYFLH